MFHQPTYVTGSASSHQPFLQTLRLSKSCALSKLISLDKLGLQSGISALWLPLCASVDGEQYKKNYNQFQYERY